MNDIVEKSSEKHKWVPKGTKKVTMKPLNNRIDKGHVVEVKPQPRSFTAYRYVCRQGRKSKRKSNVPSMVEFWLTVQSYLDVMWNFLNCWWNSMAKLI